MNHTEAYFEIRNNILSRYFAINNFFRTNYIADADKNSLGSYVPGPPVKWLVTLGELHCIEPFDDSEEVLVRPKIDNTWRPTMRVAIPRGQFKSLGAGPYRITDLDGLGHSAELDLLNHDGESQGKLFLTLSGGRNRTTTLCNGRYELHYDVVDATEFDVGSGYDARNTVDNCNGTTDPWHIGTHGRENPLLYSGQLMMCLAIEHHFGHTESLPILESLLRSIDTLFKFEGKHFDGYPIRWDAVCSDLWTRKASLHQYAGQGFQHRDRCLNFLRPGHGDEYFYITPFDHPEHVTRDNKESGQQELSDARDQFLIRYRYWEPSMDEIVGLMAGYDMAYRLVDEPTIRILIRSQASRLGDYLAEHNYMLVRPGVGARQKNGHEPASTYPQGVGGFTFRGAMNINPAFEFPFGIIFERIIGSFYSSRSSPDTAWEDTVEKAGAGIWDGLRESFDTSAIIDFLLNLVAPLETLVTRKILPILTPTGLLQEVIELLSNNDIAKALIIVDKMGELFDIQEPSEALVAFLMSRIEDPALRFGEYMRGATLHIGKYGNTFPRHLAISQISTAGTSADPVLRALYTAWLDRYAFTDKPATEDGLWRPFVEGAFVRAVGLHFHRDGEWKRDLVTQLDSCKDILLKTSDIDPKQGIDYLSAVALSWLHAANRAESGETIAVTDFPKSPTQTDFPNSSAVPAGVPWDTIRQALPGGSEPPRPQVPFQAIQQGRNFHTLAVVSDVAPLFIAPFPQKPAEPMLDRYAAEFPSSAFHTPSFIEELSIVQAASGEEPTEYAKVPGPTPCQAGSLRYQATWRMTASDSRILQVERTLPLVPGRDAYVFLRSDVLPETLAVTVIESRPDGQAVSFPVPMKFQVLGNYFHGRFPVTNTWSSDYTLTFHITGSRPATEPYPLRTEDGAALDADPSTIATVDLSRPPEFPYPDGTYQHGPDINHHIQVAAIHSQLPSDTLEGGGGNNDFVTATPVTLAVPQAQGVASPLLLDTPRDIRCFDSQAFSSSSDANFFIVNLSPSSVDDACVLMDPSEAVCLSKYLGLSVKHIPPALTIREGNQSNYCVDISVYRADKSLYRRSEHQDLVTIYNPRRRLNGKTCYVKLENSDFKGQGAFEYWAWLLYSSAHDVAYTDPNAPAFAGRTTESRKLLERYFGIVDLPRPGDDIIAGNPAQIALSAIDGLGVAVNLAKLVRQHNSFLGSVGLAEMITGASNQDGVAVLANERLDLGNVARSIKVLDVAEESFKASGSLFAKAGLKDLRINSMRYLADMYEEQGRTVAAAVLRKECGIHGIHMPPR